MAIDKLVQLNVRVGKALRRRLEQAAKAQRTTLNSFVRLRLEDSFHTEKMRSFSENVDALEEVTRRLERSYLAKEHYEQLLTAIDKGDLGEARSIVYVLRKETGGKS